MNTEEGHTLECEKREAACRKSLAVYRVARKRAEEWDASQRLLDISDEAPEEYPKVWTAKEKAWSAYRKAWLSFDREHKECLKLEKEVMRAATRHLQ